ncbi:CDP-diacylglycerol--glycerol-3-phosphate 3-phosphatidyltransferase [Candidatus Xiphinematobacter sp. Idaho Grape]|uniref:CDP-diacylglycerol--glycerol-3-phosphate 3-phosphatidyltransferase n=1 Tax=Candidatus Xiphinematobacter sp. Idaho Grape TaxID=1704307 RepID=UPI0007061307|nr:CDP-diacylglycerol--glycerol-3-phosphate 3-phosphatidyltransferase [Candidatus Xiphinematobacter sp. Idaho Grape]ALJ56209.1 CDP-diacylglycerol--glycerol-3-phosphate 3-phosphatidyltransferase [Candidatus Xiphinematobacter sp. Idaho Grape]
MTLPNRLTLARFSLTALFVAATESPFRWNMTLALIFFALAVLTDYLDGALARRRNLMTNFGILMDPLADKVLNVSAFILLVVYADLPPWVVIVIVAREFLITGLRLVAGNKGVILPAEQLGKHKTIWQVMTIFFFLILTAFLEWQLWPAWWIPIWIHGGWMFVAVTMTLTLYSGLGYLWRNRVLFS